MQKDCGIGKAYTTVFQSLFGVFEIGADKVVV